MGLVTGSSLKEINVTTYWCCRVSAWLPSHNLTMELEWKHKKLVFNWRLSVQLDNYLWLKWKSLQSLAYGQLSYVYRFTLWLLEAYFCLADQQKIVEIGRCVVTAKPCVSTKLSISSWTRWTVLFPASARAYSSAAPLWADLKLQTELGSITASCHLSVNSFANQDADETCSWKPEIVSAAQRCLPAKNSPRKASVYLLLSATTGFCPYQRICFWSSVHSFACNLVTSLQLWSELQWKTKIFDWRKATTLENFESTDVHHLFSCLSKKKQQKKRNKLHLCLDPWVPYIMYNFWGQVESLTVIWWRGILLIQCHLCLSRSFMIMQKSFGRTRVCGHAGRGPMNINSSTVHSSKSFVHVFTFVQTRQLFRRIFTPRDSSVLPSWYRFNRWFSVHSVGVWVCSVGCQRWWGDNNRCAVLSKRVLLSLN